MPLTRTGSPVTRSGFWVLGSFAIVVGMLIVVTVSGAASTARMIRTIPVGLGPGGVSSDGTHVWVAISGPGLTVGHTVSEIGVSSGRVVRTIKVGANPLGVSADTAHVWVTNAMDSTVSEI